ncbi:MAG: PAS domain S-box protein [bacterium]|nr:PAS domain S-box protein [candidate division KSB1 bacterium]MDH7561490.1 PAS domain S-box protein [bacterium]
MVTSASKAQKYERELAEYAARLRDLFAEMTADLRKSEHLYRSIVDGATDAIMTVDRNLRVLSWNKGAEEVFGYTEQEALGKTLDDLIIRPDVGPSSDYVNSQIRAGKAVRVYEAVRYTKDGQPRSVLISATPILGDDGTVQFVSLIYKDITEQKRAQEQLIQSEKQATLGVIAGSIGHELNNLVSGLLVETQLLLRRADNPEEGRKIGQRLLTHLEKVALHGRNLLSLSKPARPQLQSMDLTEVLADTTDTLVLSGVLKRFRIEKHFAPNLPAVCGDRNQIEQVIRNLEINAAHAMKSDGALTVSTSLTEDGNFVRMVIEDNGQGIPDEIKDKIFEPFFTTKAEGEGTGLGLPIVKQIVESHGGRFYLESQVGVGTRAIVEIPVAKQEARRVSNGRGA